MLKIKIKQKRKNPEKMYNIVAFSFDWFDFVVSRFCQLSIHGKLVMLLSLVARCMLLE